MKLSVITINLNNLEGLQKTVGSVLAQTWREFEYIVIDGGSTDGSAEYLSGISTDLTWWISERDRGIYHAMNKGIEKATGEYLLFLNSGDFLSGSRILETARCELTGEGIVFGDLILVNLDGTTEVKKYPDHLTFSFVWEQSLPHPASFIRRDLFERFGRYNENVRITADWQFFMISLFYHDINYKHINQEITAFNLNGMCNNPDNLKRIVKEKERFFPMKVLLVAMADSIHTARWLQQLQVAGCRVWVFPADEGKEYHKEIPVWVKRIGTVKTFPLMDLVIQSVKKKINPDYYSRRLARYIRKIGPDVVHSMETQGAGYLVAAARKRFKKEKSFPKWWHSNWGSDIFLFGRLADHRNRVREVLEHCDYYSCEGQRDIDLALKFGFTGQLLPVYPSGGGLKHELLERLKKGTEATSRRKVIMLKGYQGWAGRALTGIRSLERCADVLPGYTIVIFCNTHAADIKIAAELLAQTIGIEVKLLNEKTPNEEILTFHGQARISIGLSISDAISTSLLEAMAMGSFPIQSDTSCASEWINDGISGYLVPPEDPEIIEQAIRKALLDDDMVNAAAVINDKKIWQYADYEILRGITLQSYFKIFKNNRS